MTIKEWAFLVAALLAMLPGFLLGGYLGGQADAWMERHPGPCLIGTKADCEALDEGDEGTPLAMIGGLAGGVGSVGLFRLAVRTFHPKASTPEDGVQK